MNIPPSDSKSTFGVGRSAGVGVNRLSAASKPATGQETVSDQVRLSSLSSFLTSALSGSPERLEKLNALGGAVSSGQYQVDANTVSGSIIQHNIEFGGASNAVVTF
jgi:anti-sigma28 factor (negative regulator of flagellin synthesis)